MNGYPISRTFFCARCGKSRRWLIARSGITIERPLIKNFQTKLDDARFKSPLLLLVTEISMLVAVLVNSNEYEQLMKDFRGCF